MARENALLDLGQRLLDAAARKNWEEMALADRLLADRLAALSGEGPLDAAERNALEGLRQAHATARTRCHGEIESLAAALNEISQNKDGWLAYAENPSLDEK